MLFEKYLADNFLVIKSRQEEINEKNKQQYKQQSLEFY